MIFLCIGPWFPIYMLHLTNKQACITKGMSLTLTVYTGPLLYSKHNTGPLLYGKHNTGPLLYGKHKDLCYVEK